MAETVYQEKGESNGIEWQVTVQEKSNGRFYALVQAGKWSAFTPDLDTLEDAKKMGKGYAANMVAELEELRDD